MNLTMSERFVDNGGTCRAFDSMPGKDFPTVGAKFIPPNMQRVEVSCSGRLLVDGCGGLRVKILDPDITLLTVAQRHELDTVRPFLDNLRARKIIVVEPFEPANKSATKEELRKSGHHCDDSLKNSLLSVLGPSVSETDEMVRNFFAYAIASLGKCNHDPSYAAAGFDLVDDAGRKHHIAIRCQLCHPPANYPPLLTDQSGNDVTGQMYRVIDDANTALHCRQALVLTHRDLPITQVTLHTSGVDIYALQLNKIDDSLKAKEEAGLIDEEYYALREEFLLVRDFTGLPQAFTRLREEYIALLNTHKVKLATEQVAVALAEHVAASLLASPVIEEIKGVVSALVGLEKAQWQEDKQKQAGESERQNSQSDNYKEKSYDPEARKSAEALLTELAEVYNDNYFSDVFLHRVIATGSLGCIFSDDYFSSKEKNEVLIQLMEKGTDLTGVLASIAKNLHDLTEPFLPWHAHSNGPNM